MGKLILALSIALAWLGVAKADQTPTPAPAPTIVAADTVATKIADMLGQRLPVAGRYRVAFTDAAFALALPASAQGRFDVAALNFDPARQAFAASLTFVGANSQLQIVGVAGTAYAVVDVPAPAHDLAAGDVITAQDLTMIELPVDRISTTLISNADAIAGQAARRALRARQPLFSFDLTKPIVVKKGELVTLVFSMPGIELTAAGQALADGGKGDTIAVLNARSRRTIEGRVIGPGTVSVLTPPAALALAQQ